MTSAEPSISPKSIYPGWIVLSALFTSAMLVIGGSIYIYQLFVIPVTKELGVSRGGASNAYVALLVGLALWSPLAGRAFDRVSAKKLMVAGGLSFAVGMAVLSWSSSPQIMLLAVFVFLGIAMALAGGLAANTVTARWFERRRGRALGIAAIASSAGGFVMLPVTSYLIQTIGWRSALLVIGCAIGLIIILLALFVVRDRPSDADKQGFGEFADEHKGAETTDNKNTQSPVESEWTFGKLMRAKSFWLISFAVGLLLASDQAVLTTQHPFFTDIGFTPVKASALVTAMTGSAILGKLLVGFLAERYDIRALYALVAIFHAGLLGIFLLQPGFGVMLAFVSLFGAAVGGIYPVWSVLVSQYFGARHFGIAFGAIAMFTQTLAILFVVFINRSFDTTGSYLEAYQMFLGAVAGGLVAIAMLRPVNSANSVKPSQSDTISA